MEPRKKLEERLEKLRRDYRGRRSIIEMMEKGTSREDLAKIRKEQLDPIEDQIQRVKAQLLKSE